MVELSFQNLEDAQMFKIKNEIKFLIGNKIPKKKNPQKVFDIKICSFINELSKAIFSNLKSKKYPDLISFAFWCRERNILKTKELYPDSSLRVGLGLLFHNCPSNIPLNFAYSFIFGLITGNNNIIKMPTKNFPQADLLCEIIKKKFNDKIFNFIKNGNIFIKYDYTKNPSINYHLNKNCDGRLIWGSDETINKFKLIPVEKKNVDVFFPNRNSLGIINSDKLCKLNNLDLKKLCINFYNDTYLVDQNACSSPQIIIWTGKKINAAKKIFWNQLKKIIYEKNYFLNLNSISQKYLNFSKILISLNNLDKSIIHDQFIFLINLKSISDDLNNIKLNQGIFLQLNHDLKKNNKLKSFINKNYQTLTYFGYEKAEIKKILSDINYSGIDRVVPIGSALDMTFNWDGYDLISKLSRIIEIR